MIFRFIFPILSLMISLSTLAQNTCQEGCYQSVKNKNFKFTGNTNAVYNGCLNKFEQRSGYGTLTHEKFQYVGCFKEGQYDGQGKLVLYNSNGTHKQVYDGQFKEGQYDGYGKIQFVESNTIWEGEFKNDIMTENGHWNYENYYEPNDISFPKNSNYASLKLDKHPNKLTNHIDVKFNDITELFMFDTGADYLTISEKLFHKLKNQNIKFIDMEVEIEMRDAENEIINSKVYSVDITVGEVNIKNLKIHVGKNLSNLFGLDFFKKFSDYQICIYGKKGGECIVYKN